MDNNFKGKKVLVFGLGLNDGGLGVTEYFVNQGADVTVFDDYKTEEDLKPSLDKLKKYGDKITYFIGKGLKKDELFKENDIIIRNPAIKPDNPLLKIARNAGKQVEMEFSLFLQLAPCPIIGVTGTRGKTTTTYLIHAFISKVLGDKALLAGNMGKSTLRELPKLTDDNLAILEISNFQLVGMGETKVSPHVAVVTNIYPDHLNWHPDMEDYIKAKSNIFRNQKKGDYAVINIDNDITRKFVNQAPANVITYSLKDSKADYYTDDKLDVYERGEKLLNLGEAELEGEHNLYNMTAAIAAVRIYDVSVEQILAVLRDFEGVEFRQQFVREVGGVRFINDTTATTFEAMKVALERFGPKFPGKMIMISGGVDKGIDYSGLKPYMEKYVKALVLLEGTASEKIAEVFEGSDVKVEKFFGDFEKAVKKSYEVAESGDMVILCPGASSFNMFVNEFDRGRQFNEFVSKLK